MSVDRLTAWVCDACDYWRQELSTGVHQANNPENWRGPLLAHPLTAVEFVRADALAQVEAERDRLRGALERIYQTGRGLHVEIARDVLNDLPGGGSR